MFVMCALVACGDRIEPAGLVATLSEPPGANCANGGVAVESGQDTNGNGVLDPDEITSTRYVCAPPKELVRVVPEPAGTNCANGGEAIEIGTDSNGNGVLDDSEVTSITYVCAGTAAGMDAGTDTGPSDPYFSSVVLLMHFDGPDGGTSFKDVIGNSFSIFAGSPALSTMQSEFGGSSLLLNPGWQITTAASSSWQFGTGDFTVEFWAYRNDGTVVDAPIVFSGNTTSPSSCANTWNWAMAIASHTGGWGWYVPCGPYILNGSTIAVGAWHHFAVTRLGTTLTLWLDGAKDATTTDSTDYNISQPLVIGDIISLPRTNAFVDELRITKGVARYTAPFTAPTDEFPNH